MFYCKKHYRDSNGMRTWRYRRCHQNCRRGFCYHNLPHKCRKQRRRSLLSSGEAASKVRESSNVDQISCSFRCLWKEKIPHSCLLRQVTMLTEFYCEYCIILGPGFQPEGIMGPPGYPAPPSFPGAMMPGQFPGGPPGMMPGPGPMPPIPPPDTGRNCVIQ